MASNFGITVDKNSDDFGLKLAATSTPHRHMNWSMP